MQTQGADDSSSDWPVPQKVRVTGGTCTPGELYDEQVLLLRRKPLLLQPPEVPPIEPPICGLNG